MRTVLAALFLLAGTEAYYWGQNGNPYGHSQWSNQNAAPFQASFGYGNGRPSQQSQHSHWFPHNQQTNDYKNEFDTADWICRNPKTGDMMIIKSEPSMENVQQHHTFPPGNDKWQPQQPDRNTGNNIHPVTSYPNENTTPQSKENEGNRNKGGEGVIDVRLGGEK